MADQNFSHDWDEVDVGQYKCLQCPATFASMDDEPPWDDECPTKLRASLDARTAQSKEEAFQAGFHHALWHVARRLLSPEDLKPLLDGDGYIAVGKEDEVYGAIDKVRTGAQIEVLSATAAAWESIGVGQANLYDTEAEWAVFGDCIVMLMRHAKELEKEAQEQAKARGGDVLVSPLDSNHHPQCLGRSVAGQCDCAKRKQVGASKEASDD